MVWQIPKKRALPKTVQIYGSKNLVPNSTLEIPQVEDHMNNKGIAYLNFLGEPVRVGGGWSIRCIRFKEILLIKHLSIFKAFSLVEQSLKTLKNHVKADETKDKSSIIYLARSDNRIQNQEEIIEYLNTRPKSFIMKNLENLLTVKKCSIHRCDNILLPQGSDNINGLCFTGKIHR